MISLQVLKTPKRNVKKPEENSTRLFQAIETPLIIGFAMIRFRTEPRTGSIGRQRSPMPAIKANLTTPIYPITHAQSNHPAPRLVIIPVLALAAPPQASIVRMLFPALLVPHTKHQLL